MPKTKMVKLRYDRSTHFVIRMAGRTAAEAWDYMLEVSSYCDPGVYRAATRGYRVILRPADIRLVDFINREVPKTIVDNPLIAIRVPDDEWLFFGAYKP